jgi:CHRD domain
MTRTVLALAALGALCLGGVVPATAMTARHAPVKTLQITLQPQAFSGVTGTATVTYNAATKRTTVKVTVQHLEPGSVHPSHVHGGTCRSNGPVLEGLMSVKANAQGTGVATTTFAGAIKTPAYINVHMGPGLALTQFTVLTCGNVTKGM